MSRPLYFPIASMPTEAVRAGAVEAWGSGMDGLRFKSLIDHLSWTSPFSS